MAGGECERGDETSGGIDDQAAVPGRGCHAGLYCRAGGGEPGAARQRVHGSRRWIKAELFHGGLGAQRKAVRVSCWDHPSRPGEPINSLLVGAAEVERARSVHRAASKTGAPIQSSWARHDGRWKMSMNDIVFALIRARQARQAVGFRVQRGCIETKSFHAELPGRGVDHSCCSSDMIWTPAIAIAIAIVHGEAGRGHGPVSVVPLRI